MARIDKSQHSRILRSIDVEGRKVTEVAAEYGCTPANIYALLGRLRRAAPDGPRAVAATPAVSPRAPETSPAVVNTASLPDAADLFELAPVETPVPAEAARPPARPGLASVPQAAGQAGTEPARQATSPTAHLSSVTDLPRRGPAGRRGAAPSLAKAGYGLAMRTEDGDENLTPFRSLEDLLSAIKPILRAASRSPDAVWFSIQSVDLANLDSDAA